MQKIYAEEIYTGQGLYEQSYLLFDAEIKAILSKEEGAKAQAEELPRASIITPGFIDLHIHGSGGADVMDATPEALKQMASVLPKFGCTAFLATTMTQTPENIEKALLNLKHYLAKQEQLRAVEPLAEILGAHLEGPFISKQRCGAQDPSLIIEPNIENCRFLEPYYDLIKIMVVAPEEDNDCNMIRRWTEMGIICSLGHTNASFEEAYEGYVAGLSHVTHCFNAMSPMHHRAPGAVTAALTLPLNTEMIVDGEHLHPEIVKLICDLKERRRRILVTDAMRAAGLGECESELGGQKVYVRDGRATLEDGTIAGSVLDLATALRNTILFTGNSLGEVIEMLTYNPAAEIGIEDQKGQLKAGADADFLIFDAELNLEATYIGGKRHQG
ncbi:MAG: N-acetylglucosamine-6-phosphate deacetylase [Eubacteriales bacterium]|nr:N-acetylglucosamine-6-phosphate deacetylase [Eubacteriales bacterium]